MRKMIRTIAAALVCMALICPAADARGRNQGQGQSQPGQNSFNPGNRPGNNGRPSGASQNQGFRPGSGNNNPGNNNPGIGNNNPGNNNGNRPGIGNNNPGNNNNGFRPGNNSGIGNNNPGMGRPNGNHGNSGMGNPGMGNPGAMPGMPPVATYPHNPAPRPFVRPVAPPASYRPMAGWPTFRSILGIAFGTAVNMSLNALLNSGYTVSGYGNNAVYLANVPMLNFSWPSATLYYTNGGLSASEFVYSTSYYDMQRYNLVYNQLIANYGYPYQVQNLANGGVQANWWGGNGQFITLTYSQGYANNGMLRYFTTLSYGM